MPNVTVTRSYVRPGGSVLVFTQELGTTGTLFGFCSMFSEKTTLPQQVTIGSPMQIASVLSNIGGFQNATILANQASLYL